MKITKLELLSDGMNGISVTSIKQKVKEEVSVFYEDKETYKIPVTREIIDAFQSLKSYMAMVLDIFGEELSENEILLHRIMTSLQVTKIQRKSDVYQIMGKITNRDNLTVGISTPLIMPDTDYGFYSEIDEIFHALGKLVKEFVESDNLKKMEPMQFLLNLFPDNEDKRTEINALSEKEQEEEMIRILEARGHVILPSPEDVRNVPVVNISREVKHIETPPEKAVNEEF